MKHISEADSAAAAASASLKATVLGGGTLAAGGLTSNDFAIFGGFIIALAGFILQFIYQRRRDRREQAEADDKHRLHLAQLAAIQAEVEASRDRA
jgi:hypothetical protein